MKLAFRQTGSGHPVVILHGLFGQSDNWNTIAKKLGENGFQVFTVDLRNHGLSPHSKEFNFTLLAEDLHEFISEHRVTRPILIGHSLGGKVVLFHELKYPGSAKSLVIADMSARAYEPQHTSVLAALNAVNFDKVGTRKGVEEVLTSHSLDVGTRQFLLKNVHWVDETAGKLGWRFNLDSLTRNYPEVNKQVPEFQSETPALVIRGERSSYVNEKDLDDFKRRFKKLEVATIPGAGHWVHAENPAAFFDAVYRFISAEAD
jgi:esterase